MRIISGFLKGRKLIPPKGVSVRPTADRAKETLFNILANRFSFTGMGVLELYCGSGAIGLECISRGADKATFVDTDTRLAEQNAEALGVSGKCRFIRADAMTFLKGDNGNFQFLFADPPYDFNDYDDLSRLALKRCDILVIEHSSGYSPSGELREKITAERKAGKAHFTIFDNSTSK